MKKVIYTAITGKYDNLQEPEYIPKGYDFICFTDHKINKSNSIWNIKHILPLYNDNTRVARKYKILPHRFLPEYDLSIWIDGNFIIKDGVAINAVATATTGLTVFGYVSASDGFTTEGNITGSNNISASGDGIFNSVKLDAGAASNMALDFQGSNPTGLYYDGTNFVWR